MIARSIWIGAVVIVLLASTSTLPVAASPPSATNCKFVLGFKALHDLIPSIVGECLVDEHHNPLNGDGLQETTAWHGKGGLMVWRKADNWTAFTDGTNTWINGPYGLQKRPNTERFPWENAPANSTPTAAPPPVQRTPTPAPAAAAPLTLGGIDGIAVLVGADGAYLGKVSSNRFDAESVCNEFGLFGSRFSPTSVRNRFGTYGSEFGPFSAYNRFSQKPPLVVLGRTIVALLTKNNMLGGALDPDRLFAAYGCVYR